MPERPGESCADETRPDQIQETAAFLRRSFPKAQHLTDDYFRWFYLDNPDGVTLSSNCVRNTSLVGHVALTPLVAHVHGKRERGVLVNNVATDPEFAGRGLFTDLLSVGLEAAAGRGSTFAVSVPNSQSVGAFVKRTGFTSLGPLEARIGLFRPPAPSRAAEFAFERRWSPDALRWRLSNPEASYRWQREGGRLVIDADSGTLGIRVELASFDRTRGEIGEVPTPPGQSHRRSSGPLSRLPIHLYVGIDARRTWTRHAGIPIPMRFRPAPLHLVMRDLTAESRQWTRESIHFRALDFDAF